MFDLTLLCPVNLLFFYCKLRYRNKSYSSLKKVIFVFFIPSTLLFITILMANETKMCISDCDLVNLSSCLIFLKMIKKTIIYETNQQLNYLQGKFINNLKQHE